MGNGIKTLLPTASGTQAHQQTVNGIKVLLLKDNGRDHHKDSKVPHLRANLIKDPLLTVNWIKDLLLLDSGRKFLLQQAISKYLTILTQTQLLQSSSLSHSKTITLLKVLRKTLIKVISRFQ
jgi:hypothetical protein